VKLRGGWGRPVLRAVCDHSPVRLRLFETGGVELAIVYYACRHCEQPLFLNQEGRPVEPMRADECGCIWPHVVCSYHGHPVHAPLDHADGGRRGD